MNAPGSAAALEKYAGMPTQNGAIELSGAEMVIRALKDQGVKHIFGYPGGAVLPIYDALFAAEGIIHVLVRHEQGAVHAAEGYARATGKPGVVLVTSGPGATNAVTGLTDALMDSIPLVVLTGQVATHLIGTDAFQEADTVGITRACTKHNWLVKDVNDLSPRDARGVPDRDHRPSRPGRGRHPQGCAVQARALRGARCGPPPHLQAQDRSGPVGHREGDRTDGRCEEATVLHRRRHHQFGAGGEPAAARTGASDRLSRDLDPDGPGRVPGLRPAMAGPGRHARHLRGQPCDARLRRDDLPGRPLRRPRHRQYREIRAAFAEDPSRHRRGPDQQERPRRRGDRRRRGQGAERAAALLEDPEAKGRRAGVGRVVEADRRLAHQEIARLQEFEQADQAAACHRPALCADARSRRLHHHRGRASTRCGRRSASSSRSRTAG